MKKRLFIQTFGCQMNVHDSEQMAALMGQHGYETVADAADADLILVNTCSIREKAAQKIMSQLGRYRSIKRSRPETIIGVGGCLAQHLGEDLVTRNPHVDLVFGTHNLHRLPEMVIRIEQSGEKVIETSLAPVVPSLGIRVAPRENAISAFVTIMQGCNNYCAYCVVPFLRGPETSRPGEDILNEIKMLVDGGIREVTLLGQNVNSYGHTLSPRTSFPELLRGVGRIDGLERIRFTTSHPKDLSDDLVRCFGEIRSLCEHIHLPAQSGSDRILRAMNRGYTSEEYRNRVKCLREQCPEIAVTSDMIVGFPGETNEDFQRTLDLMETIRFDNLFSFKYSERKGTAAVHFPDPVPETEKAERLETLQARQEGHTLEKNRDLEGRLVEVLVEGRSKNSPDDMSGRTRTNRIVNFTASADTVRKTVPVRIERAFLHSLRGKIEHLGGVC